MSQNYDEPVETRDCFSLIDIFVDVRPLQFTERSAGVYEATYRDANAMGSPLFGVTVWSDNRSDDARSRVKELVDQLQMGFVIVSHQPLSPEEEQLPEEAIEELPDVEETIEFELKLLELEHASDLDVVFVVGDGSISANQWHHWRSNDGAIHYATVSVSIGRVNFYRNYTVNTIYAGNEITSRTKAIRIEGLAANNRYNLIGKFHRI